jgi:hypothetical protein
MEPENHQAIAHHVVTARLQARHMIRRALLVLGDEKPACVRGERRPIVSCPSRTVAAENPVSATEVERRIDIGLGAPLFFSMADDQECGPSQKAGSLAVMTKVGIAACSGIKGLRGNDRAQYIISWAYLPTNDLPKVLAINSP